MKKGEWKLGIGIFLLLGALAGSGSDAYSNEEKQVPHLNPVAVEFFRIRGKSLEFPSSRLPLK